MRMARRSIMNFGNLERLINDVKIDHNARYTGPHISPLAKVTTFDQSASDFSQAQFSKDIIQGNSNEFVWGFHLFGNKTNVVI